MFERLLDSIDDDYLRYITHIEAVPPPPAESATDLSRASFESQPQPESPAAFAAPGVEDAPPLQEPEVNTPFVKQPNEKLGRNEPCWCGSGKKFKFCHGRA
jgi:preprotein translocase subunit SecA